MLVSTLFTLIYLYILLLFQAVFDTNCTLKFVSQIGQLFLFLCQVPSPTLPWALQIQTWQVLQSNYVCPPRWKMSQLPWKRIQNPLWYVYDTGVSTTSSQFNCIDCWHHNYFTQTLVQMLCCSPGNKWYGIWEWTRWCYCTGTCSIFFLALCFWLTFYQAFCQLRLQGKAQRLKEHFHSTQKTCRTLLVYCVLSFSS